VLPKRGNLLTRAKVAKYPLLAKESLVTSLQTIQSVRRVICVNGVTDASRYLCYLYTQKTNCLGLGYTGRLLLFIILLI
jgi:hypothetical protein